MQPTHLQWQFYGRAVAVLHGMVGEADARAWESWA